VAGLVPAVANHESRRVYDARVERLRAAAVAGSEGELATRLCEAVLLGLWRARNVTGFDALAQDIVGLDAKRARALAEQGAQRLGVTLERLPDLAVAAWLRCESGLLERCPDAALEVSVRDGRLQLVLRVPLAPPLGVPDALSALGRAGAGLGRVLVAELPPPRPPRETPER
jgi:hypothetical protein